MRVPYETLYQELRRVLLAAGFQRDHAELAATLFADASRDGVFSHGLNRFPKFVESVADGTVDVDAVPVRIDAIGSLERWDGRFGPGNLNAHASMRRAIGLARESGIGCVALRNTNHWMRGGSYGWQAAEAGVIAFCWTNTMPNMPPWGGRDARVGNNPLVIAIPRPEGHVVLDMAMSLFSYGKLATYRSRGEQLPVDGGYDQAGRLTRDPGAIEMTARPLPAGFWKGSGLAFALDLVAAVLSAGNGTHQIGPDDRGVSQVFLALDPARLEDDAVADHVVREAIAFLHSATPADGAQSARYPGERTLATRLESMRLGVPVEPSVWDRVRSMHLGDSG